ncbi:Uncharacterized membrane protein [Clostridium cavendishii DSM 21758]|uniref:Uncharacterized membrane protein n=1 Tax=Clostridium cavendishii DSM 21758 TaxID=1121302 RepID=A0A1M6EZN7_9CLOT|nr:putative ABC transporter permease [Clostridium cavendishii]SHI90849.1 Uncharacterized membrane protein [Clostridium cavendishii DSM 21758]
MNPLVHKKEVKSFVEGVNYYKISWIFIFFSVIGFIIESLWCLITNGFIESRRGLIYGPFSQIYGFGAVIFILTLIKLKANNNLKIFIYSYILGAIFEYISSFAQQIIFGSVSWVYNDDLIGINGRTSLLYSLFWGVLGLVLMLWLYPLLNKFLKVISNKKGIILTNIIVIFIVLDMLISGLAVYREQKRNRNIPPSNEIEKVLDEYYPNDYMDKVYPNMKFTE